MQNAAGYSTICLHLLTKKEDEIAIQQDHRGANETRPLIHFSSILGLIQENKCSVFQNI